MKKSILILMSVLFSYSVYANDLIPVAVQSSTPNQTWFYNLEDVVFDADDSYVPNGYIVYTKWYINGVYQDGGSYYRDMSECFALYGSPSNGCYQLASGQTTVDIKLEVQSNHGYWHSETITYTIQEHKGRKYFVKDHLGSVRVTVNRDGNVLGYDDYYPFGLTMPGRSSNSANPNDDYKFTGYEQDNEAGLDMYHANARSYDPVLGRFNQIDPKFDHPALVGLSPYNYALNNPMKYNDPDGECPPALCGAIVGAVIGATVELGSQAYQNYKSGNGILENIDYKQVGSSAIDGAITGAVAGATMGTSLVVSASANSAASVVGGAVERGINGEEVFDAGDIVTDALAGGLGGAAANVVEKKLVNEVTESVSRSFASGLVRKATQFLIKKTPSTARGAIKGAVNAASDAIKEIVTPEKKEENE